MCTEALSVSIVWPFSDICYLLREISLKDEQDISDVLLRRFSVSILIVLHIGDANVIALLDITYLLARFCRILTYIVK